MILEGSVKTTKHLLTCIWHPFVRSYSLRFKKKSPGWNKMEGVLFCKISLLVETHFQTSCFNTNMGESTALYIQKYNVSHLSPQPMLCNCLECFFLFLFYTLSLLSIPLYPKFPEERLYTLERDCCCTMGDLLMHRDVLKIISRWL